ncbi:MAG TPA: extracellular solute-binding protein [Solirubrobacteraceae bacterium]|nr:extracellular solute-binding protein [Solirubrobacteraceae bacterium]
MRLRYRHQATPATSEEGPRAERLVPRQWPHRIASVGASAILLAGVAAGCGGSSSSTSSAKSAGGGSSATLNIMGFGTNGDDVAQTRFAIAQKAIAPAKVSAPNGGFNDQQFLASVAGGNPPDLIYTDRYQIGSLAARGALEPLNSCISTQHVAMSQFRPPAVQELTDNGQVYGIPEFYDNRVIIVNNTAVKAAGLAPSDLGTTNWSNLAQVTKKLVKASGGKLSEVGFDPKIPEFFPLWAKANGAELISSNGMHPQLDTPQVIQALTYAVSLIKEQGGWNQFSAFRNTFNFFGADNEVAKNQLAAWPMEDWYFNVLATTSPKVSITTMPVTSRTGQPLDWETGSAWAIPKGAKNAKLACTWAKAMTATSTWIAAASNRKALYAKKHQYWTGLFTANIPADAAIDKPTPGEPKQWVSSMDTVLKIEPDAFGMPASPASLEFETAWTNAVTRVLQGQQTAQQALAQAQSEAQAAISAASKGGAAPG